jgi:sugar phosphate isomerase/epimerase
MKVSNLPFGLILTRVRNAGLPSLVEWVRFCADNGLDGIEIGEDWLRHLSWAEVVAFIDVIRESPIEVSGLTVHNHMNCPPGESRDAAAQQIRRFVGMARLLGAPSIRIESGAWGDYERYRMSRQQAIDNTVQTIEHCLPIAAEGGVTLAIENHPGWVTRFADALVEVLERIQSKHLVLNLDTGSLYRDGQRPADFLKHDIVAARTYSLHLKSIRFEPNPEIGWWNQGVPFEESQVDYGYIFSALKSAKFDAWISYEAHESVGLAGIAEGARFARRLWTELDMA